LFHQTSARHGHDAAISWQGNAADKRPVKVAPRHYLPLRAIIGTATLANANSSCSLADPKHRHGHAQLLPAWRARIWADDKE